MNNNLLIIDACCLINICASGKLAEIIEGTPFDYLVSKTVHDTEMVDTEVIDSLNPINMRYDDIINNGLLKVVDFSDESEIHKFLFYAQIIDGDGEAASLVIAEGSDYILATDDKKAIKVTKEYAPNLQLLTTPELMKSWFDTSDITEQEIKEALSNITVYGRYKPSKNNPLKSWWEGILK